MPQDHHCAVIDRCVGGANGAFFLGYAASTAGACVSFCALLSAAAAHWHWSVLLRFAWWDFSLCGGVALALALRQCGAMLAPPKAPSGATAADS